jgi:hypothetical protein
MTVGLTPQDIANVAAVSAFVIPPVVSLLKRENWSAGVKQTIAIAISAIVGIWALIIGHVITGAVITSPESLITAVGLAFTASQIAYRGFAGSKVDTRLTAIGSPKPAPPTAVFDASFAPVPTFPPPAPVVEVPSA